MNANQKRKAEDESSSQDKRVKTKKNWRVPRKNDHIPVQARSIQPGESGIWVTCNKGKEGKCIGEMLDLLNEYAARLYPDAATQESDTLDSNETNEVDIEKSIQDEVDNIRKPVGPRLFTPVKLDVQCVVFFKTVLPVEPVSLVKTICEEAMTDRSLKRTRFAKRLSPMSLVGRASMEGLEKVATETLATHFHREPFRKRKFAIRPTIRNHNILNRDTIIKSVAAIVGPGHEVDLTNYDLLIIVEVYQYCPPRCQAEVNDQNVCGVSVVDNNFERLKRYNISEIFDPTPRDDEK